MSDNEPKNLQLRLKDIILKRYDCHLEWLPAGGYELHGGEHLSNKERTRLDDLISLVVEASDKTLTENSLLNTLERQLLEGHKFTKNILSLEHARRKKIESLSTYPLYESGGRDFRAPCLIEAEHFTDIQKMALEIHEHSNSLAFIRLEQLPEEIGSLGKITLFIPDICKLNIRQQQQLLSIMTSMLRREGPHIIAGTIIPLVQLKEIPQFDPIFLKRISSLYIRMTKPFEQYKKLDVWTHIFDSLAF